MMVPGSRTYFCYKDSKVPNGSLQPTNAACAAAIASGGTTPIYNWFAVLRSDGAGRVNGFIPDGQLCSGGKGGPYDFTAYNAARSDWPYTRLTAGSSITFDYNNWAKHPGTFYLYITKDGYSPSKALSWGDLEPTPFASVTNPTSIGGPGSDDGKYTWTARLPAGKTGKHIIYSVWSRSDSTETFYGCSDVSFDGGNGQVVGIRGGETDPATPPVSTPPVDTPPVSTPPVDTPPVSTPPVSSPPPVQGACTAAYSTSGSWDNGFQANVTVKAGSSALSKWSVSWTWPGNQKITQAWGGKATASGSLTTVTNETYNGSLGAGASTTFGFLGSGSPPLSLPNLTCSA